MSDSSAPSPLISLPIIDASAPVAAAVPPQSRRLPPWLRQNLAPGGGHAETAHLIAELGLETVCSSAKCPNRLECWSARTATFMILGNVCTRPCGFCSVPRGKTEALELDEPERVAEAARRLGLEHVVITSVTRDDLPDGGAWLYAETVRAIKRLNPTTGVELLAPDFNGEAHLLREVFDSRPEVFAHNLETVPRIFKRIRPAFRYQRSLDVITAARDFGLVTKSNLILGMGETIEEVHAALADLHAAGCDIVTITQYLRPSPRHHPVERWVAPEEFVALADYAEKLGFAGVLAAEAALVPAALVAVAVRV